MIVYAFILLYEAAAVALTAAGCWLAVKLGRKAGWYLALLGAVGPAIVAVLASESSDYLFTVVHYNEDGHWGHLTESDTDVRWLFALLTGIAAIPALLVVRHYRRRFSNRAQAHKNILVIIGSLLALAILVRHYRDCRFEVVQLDASKGHYPETIADMMWSSMLLTGAAVISTWLVVRHYCRRFPDRTQARNHILVMMALLLALAILVLHYREIDAYRCPSCLSGRIALQWRFGLWRGPSIPLASAYVRSGDNYVRQDLLPADHVHELKFLQSLALHFFGTMRTGLARSGDPRQSEFFWKYEGDPEFRKFIGMKLQDGSLTKSNVIALVLGGQTGKDSPLQKDAEALFNAYLRR
ncbi:MAG: hypothetical protein ABL967_19510 [Bryobacteraceae bacterium]